MSRGRDRFDRRDRFRGDDGCSVFVRGLDTYTTIDVLRNIFRKFGPLVDVYVPKNYYTGERRGFAYIQYEDPRDASEAIKEMDDTEIDGKVILCKLAEGRRKTPREMKGTSRSGRFGGRYNNDSRFERRRGRRDDSPRRGRYRDDRIDDRGDRRNDRREIIRRDRRDERDDYHSRGRRYRESDDRRASDRDGRRYVRGRNERSPPPRYDRGNRSPRRGGNSSSNDNNQSRGPPYRPPYPPPRNRGGQYERRRSPNHPVRDERNTSSRRDDEERGGGGSSERREGWRSRYSKSLTPDSDKELPRQDFNTSPLPPPSRRRRIDEEEEEDDVVIVTSSSNDSKKRSREHDPMGDSTEPPRKKIKL